MGVPAALDRYFGALRRNDLAGVLGVLAPDYSFDPGDVQRPFFDPRNPFQRPLGLTYYTLNVQTQALTTVGNTATAIVATNFEADLNLEFLGLGQSPVRGNATQ